MINDQERQDMIEFMQRELKRREILLKEADKKKRQELDFGRGARGQQSSDKYEAYVDRASAILAGLQGELPEGLKKQYEKEKQSKEGI